MGKKNLSSPDQVADKVEESPEAVQATRETGDSSFPVIILAYAGTEERMKALWEKNYEGEIQILTVQPEYSLLQQLAEIVCEKTIPDEFYLVEANTFPVCKINDDILRIPKVYVDRTGELHYRHKLPIRLNKTTLLELLADVKSESEFNPDKFLKEATREYGRPLRVSHHFGNMFLSVITGTPCQHKVIQGFIERYFVGTTPAGWSGIVKIIDQYLA